MLVLLLGRRHTMREQGLMPTVPLGQGGLPQAYYSIYNQRRLIVALVGVWRASSWWLSSVAATAGPQLMAKRTRQLSKLILLSPELR